MHVYMKKVYRILQKCDSFQIQSTIFMKREATTRNKYVPFHSNLNPKTRLPGCMVYVIISIYIKRAHGQVFSLQRQD